MYYHKKLISKIGPIIIIIIVIIIIIIIVIIIERNQYKKLLFR